mgnify:CR=1 FL=1
MLLSPFPRVELYRKPRWPVRFDRRSHEGDVRDSENGYISRKLAATDGNGRRREGRKRNMKGRMSGVLLSRKPPTRVQRAILFSNSFSVGSSRDDSCTRNWTRCKHETRVSSKSHAPSLARSDASVSRKREGHGGRDRWSSAIAHSLQIATSWTVYAPEVGKEDSS